MCILLGFITVKRVNFLNLDLPIVLTVGLSFFRYTSKMLLAAIDENHRGTYDFLYLPIDFKASLLWTSDAFFRNSQVDLKKVNSNVEPKLNLCIFLCRINAMWVMLSSTWCLHHTLSPSMRFISLSS